MTWQTRSMCMPENCRRFLDDEKINTWTVFIFVEDSNLLTSVRLIVHKIYINRKYCNNIQGRLFEFKQIVLLYKEV